MDPLSVQCVVGPIVDWPDEHVIRAHRLTVMAWRALTTDRSAAAEGDSRTVDAEIAGLQAEAERFGLELVRRGIW